MKIFSREQIALIDRQTRDLEPISEIGLMERASVALAGWIHASYTNATRIAVFAGPGNNGGDALAVARILASRGYPIVVYLPDLGRQRSEASLINLDRLKECSEVAVIEVNESSDFPDLSDFDLLLDGLYGSGLSRPLVGFAGEVIDGINDSGVEVISIDLPSGLLCDENQYNTGSIVRADYTLTLEFPKLALFFSENEQFPQMGHRTVWFDSKVMEETSSNHYFLDQRAFPFSLNKNKIFSGKFWSWIVDFWKQGKPERRNWPPKGPCVRAWASNSASAEPAAGFLQIALPEAMTSLDSGKR